MMSLDEKMGASSPQATPLSQLSDCFSHYTLIDSSSGSSQSMETECNPESMGLVLRSNEVA